jgi:hypothetical protein
MRIDGCRRVDGALQVLETAMIPVVLCECELGKVTSRRLLARVEQLEDPPFLIVVSSKADEFLWAEAVNLGAYDVLASGLGSGANAGSRLASMEQAERPRRAEVA